jgi:hypothetical protein
VPVRWKFWLGLSVAAVTISALSALSVLLLLVHFDAGNLVAQGLSKEALLRLRPGMSEQEVLAVAGAPLFEHHYHGPGVGTQLTNQAAQVIWQYAAPGFAASGFAAYVTFESGRVEAIGLKYDDFGVYACKKSSCPQFIGSEAVLDRLPKHSH